MMIILHVSLLLFFSGVVQIGNAQERSHIVEQIGGSRGENEKLDVEKIKENILPSKKIESLVDGLKNPDDKIKAQTLNEIEQLAGTIKLEKDARITKRVNEITGKEEVLEYSPDYHFYVDADIRLRKKINLIAIDFLNSDNPEIRMTAMRVLASGDFLGGSKVAEALIGYGQKHRGDDEICEVFFNVNSDFVWARLLNTRDESGAQKCVENEKYSVENRQNLCDFIKKDKIWKQKEEIKTTQLQKRDEQDRMDKNIQLFYVILLISLSTALFLTFGFSGLSLRKKIGHAAWLGPLVAYLFVIIYATAMSKPDPPSPSPAGDFLLLVILAPIAGLPGYIVTVFSTWQITILLERFKNRPNLPLNWWIFLVIITLINVCISYLGITGGFVLRLA
jgi:hypothetical protein